MPSYEFGEIPAIPILLQSIIRMAGCSKYETSTNPKCATSVESPIGRTCLAFNVNKERLPMAFRRVLLALHLWAALLASVFLLLLGATGSFMVYEREIDHVLNRRLVTVQPASQPLTLTELFGRLEKSHPGHKVTGIEFPHQPDIADEVYLDTAPLDRANAVAGVSSNADPAPVPKSCRRTAQPVSLPYNAFV